MSWIADLAGKAESLLNNIDQSAAGAIKSSETLTSLTKGAVEKPQEKSAPINYRHSVAQIDYSKESSKISEENMTQKSSPKLHTTPRPVKSKTTKATKDKDEALFDFLNSREKVSTPRPKAPGNRGEVHKSRSSTSVASTTATSNPEKQSAKTVSSQKDESVPLHAPPVASFYISRSSSIDSTNSRNVAAKIPIDNGSSSSEQTEAFSEADMVPYPADSTASESEFELVSNTAPSSTGASERDSSEEVSEPLDKSRAPGLQMENQMLQNEITALHQEMKSLSERNIRSKTDMEKRMNQLQRKHDDLLQQFTVKNSQLDAMRIQVNDLDNENKTLKNTVNNLQNERERIIDDQTAGSGMHAQALEQLRSRLEESESSLIRERDLNLTLKESALAEREKQEDELKKLAESLRKSERERQAEKKRLNDVVTEINTLQGSLAASKHELSDYKQKASRILQSKERLITSLKGGSELDITSSTSASIELEEMKQERDALKEDLISSRAELIQFKNDFQDMEGQYQQENSVLQDEVEELKRNLEDELGAKREAEADVNRYEQEMRREREEATRARAAMNERLQDKEEEIGRLRSQLMMRSRSAPDETELESRLKQLTEALIQKQTLVETVSTEKSSLLLQLERAEGQIKRLSQENSLQMQSSMNDGGEGAGTHLRNAGNTGMFSFSSGTEQGVVGQVRKAASAVDRFSVRLGVFLRRYPIARLFVILYMGLLHLWVMIVLLTYTPEIHGNDYHSQGEGNVQHQAEHGLPKDA